MGNSSNKKKANVLVIGISGVGKTTLIEAVCAEKDLTPSIYSTKKLKIYANEENEQAEFRLVDTVGYDFGFRKQRSTIGEIKKWAKKEAKKDENDSGIHAIWYCIDSHNNKRFDDVINDMSKATKMWNGVPVIAVLTKSYSIDNDEENIKIVRNAFEKSKYGNNLKKIIPVVASTYNIDATEGIIREPRNIDMLVDETNKLLPVGLQVSAETKAKFNIKRKRYAAQSLIAVVTAGSSAVGAIPFPTPDAPILAAMETGMIVGIGKIYGVSVSKQDKTGIVSALISAGSVSLAAKTLANALKSIPNIAASVINAIVAGAIVAALGEVTIALMEAIRSGRISDNNIDEIKDFIGEKINNTNLKSISDYVEKNKNEFNGKSVKEILNIIIGLFKKS